MNSKVLVAYATMAGSTAGVAKQIGDTLIDKNLTVDVLDVDQVTDLSEYETVILGSGIRGGTFFTKANAFIEKYKSVLGKKNFHVFLVCLTMREDTTANRATADGYLNPIRSQVKPRSEGLFAGAYDSSKVNFMEKMIMRAIHAPEGDFRKWDEISAWAERIATTIR
jgi:menaquinone-dependent protoporphyrinogen oxidase